MLPPGLARQPAAYLPGLLLALPLSEVTTSSCS